MYNGNGIWILICFSQEYETKCWVIGLGLSIWVIGLGLAGSPMAIYGGFRGNTEKSVILKASSSKPSIWYGITKQIVS